MDVLSVDLDLCALDAYLVYTCTMINIAYLHVLTNTSPTTGLEYASYALMTVKHATAMGLVYPVTHLTIEYTATKRRDVFPLMVTLTIFQGLLRTVLLDAELALLSRFVTHVFLATFWFLETCATQHVLQGF